MVMDSLDKALNVGNGGGLGNGGGGHPVMVTGGGGSGEHVASVVTTGMHNTLAPVSNTYSVNSSANMVTQQQLNSTSGGVGVAQQTTNLVVVPSGTPAGASAPIAVHHPQNNSSSASSIVGGRVVPQAGPPSGTSSPLPQYPLSRVGVTNMASTTAMVPGQFVPCTSSMLPSGQVVSHPSMVPQQQTVGVVTKVMPQVSNNHMVTSPHAHFVGGGAGDPLDTSNSVAAAVLGMQQLPGGMVGPNGLNINYNDATEVNKMFIGGLSWNTNDSMLYHHFSKYGEVVEHCVMRDAATQRSRGFGFVKFADAEAVERVLSEPQAHIIDEKTVDPKRAVPKYQSKLINKTKKVFLGGLPPDTNNEDVQQHFARFGEVEEVMLMYDRTTHRLRGFGFVKFAQEEAAEAACREHYHEIKGKMVEAKKAQPKEAMTNMQLKKWSYGPTAAISGAPTVGADPTLPFYLSSSQRTPMFANNPAAAMGSYNGQFHPNFAYSPVMNYPGSPTFQVGSPIGAPMGAERSTTPSHFLFGDLIASPFNGQLPTRPTTMSPSPLDSFTRETFLSTLPYMSAGSPRQTTGITSPPLTTGLDTSGHEFAGILATSPQTTGFQFGSPFGFGTVPPAMVAAYQGYNT